MTREGDRAVLCGGKDFFGEGVDLLYGGSRVFGSRESRNDDRSGVAVGAVQLAAQETRVQIVEQGDQVADRGVIDAALARCVFLALYGDETGAEKRGGEADQSGRIRAVGVVLCKGGLRGLCGVAEREDRAFRILGINRRNRCE